MSLPKDVPFIARAGAAPNPRAGFEGLDERPVAPPPDVPPKPDPASAPSPVQKARANDLFLSGALTPEQLAKAKTDRAGFEVIVGKSNFLPAVFLETGASTSRATCHIRTSGVNFRGRSGEWAGTGFLVAPNVVLTNNHVLNSPAAAANGTCVFNYQADADGRPSATRAFRLRPDRLFVTSPAVGGLDYTFCWVDGEPGSEFGAVRVSRSAFAIAELEFANVISHPDGRMKEIAIHENEVRGQEELVVHYTSDTEPGSSGAAVCNNNWQLIALHHASKDSRVAEFRLLNEGVKVSAIAADLERRVAAGGRGADLARELLALFSGTDEELGFFGGLGRASGAPTAGPEALVETYQGTDQDLDVAFWNVEWLTKWYPTKTPAVAKVIRQLNLDVWALEESSPNATKAIVQELADTYGLEYDWAAAEPDSADGKQSCTILWNTKTVDCEPAEWGEPIETWLKVHSQNFDALGFEAVHGKVFDRYPALFRVTAKPSGDGPAFRFFLVPLHLKAKAEGSLRRQMASRILAAAVKKKVEQDGAADFVIGGDYNAELATADFDALIGGGMVPLGAADEDGGAFSYIKGPKSLIDHIFLSPNLATRYGADDFFIVAADKTFPNYVSEVSDHRPVLVRMRLADAPVGPADGHESTDAGDPAAALAELSELLAAARFDPEAGGDEFEARRRRRRPTAPRPSGGAARAAGYADRTGYDPQFLGRDFVVPLPGLSARQSAAAAVADSGASGVARFALPYTHFSVVMNGDRRLAFYSAVNIDGTQLRRIPRSGDKWQLDPRIPAGAQVGNEVYKNNDLDRGHLTRRLDPVWGTPDEAARADADTFHYTNAAPQHKNLNQREWNDLEDYILDNAGAHELKVSVFTGPVFRDTDADYRGVKLPKEFWKVVVMVRADTRQLSATAYVLSQADMITGFEFVFGEFRTYQVPVSRVAGLTGLDFGRLADFDPMARVRAGGDGFESAAAGAKLVAGPESLIL